jgi:hypothetical protein
VGAGQRFGLPRQELWPSSRRGGPADHRHLDRQVLRPRDRRPARSGLPHLLPEKDFPRVSNVVFPGYPFPDDPLAEPLDPDSVPAKTDGPPFDEVAEAATDAWRGAEIPAGNGHGNARSIARIQSIVCNAGEVDGVRLLSLRTIELIFDQQSDGVDLALGLPARFGIGYGQPHPDLAPYLPDGRCCFWFGWGGAIVVNDLDRQMTYADVMNKMALSSPGGLGTERSEAYTKAAFSCADA